MSKLLVPIFLLVLALAAGCGSPAAPTSAPPTSAPPLAATNTAAVEPTSVPTSVPPTAAPTTAPTGAPTAPAASGLIAVQLQDNTIRFVDRQGKQAGTYSAGGRVDTISIFPPGNVVGGDVFLPLDGPSAGVVRVNAQGGTAIGGITGQIYGLAASQKGLAWGSADLQSGQTSIRAGALDGSDAKIAYQEKFTGAPRVLRVMRWSNDGSSLYFGKEPVGLGGYILFSGLTNLWKLDPATGKATEVMHEAAPNAAICIDDLSADEKFAVDHCKINALQVTELATKTAKAIAAPANSAQFKQAGGARFSPDGKRVAYGMARGNADDELGIAVVADVATGASTMIGTSPAKDYFQAVAWVDANTILLQSSGDKPGVWTVGADGSGLARLTDGIFVGLTGK